jgi:protein O-mannosyl-transferase
VPNPSGKRESRRIRGSHPSARGGGAPRGRGAQPQLRGTGGPRLGAPGVTLLALVLGATFFAYLGAFGHPFLNWDDLDYVVENSLVLHHQTGTLLRAIVSSNYHPLTMLSLTWNVGHPLSPKPFLITNTVLHTINAGLVFWLALLLSGGRLWAAFWASLLFGIHPMHVESVAWISERKDVLYTAFFLAASIAYWHYLDRRKPHWLLMTFLLFVLSCLSKGMAVVFPVVMVLLDLWKRRRDAWSARGLLEKAPFFAVALLFGLIALDVQGAGDFHGLLLRTDLHLKGTPNFFPYSPLQRAVLPAYGFAAYAWHLFVPVGLSPIYPYPTPAEAADWKYFLPPLFLLGALALAVWDFRRTRILTLGIGWYAATLAPVLQWIPVGEAIMADRYTYLSYVGPLTALAMGIALLWEKAPQWRIPVTAACGAFAVLLFLGTKRQIEVWKDSETLWTRVIREFPMNPVGYVSRGNARGSEGRVREALVDLQTARRLGGSRGNLFDGLGNAYGSLGQLDSAVVMYNQGLALEPNMGRTYYNRAIAYLRLQRPAEALQDLERAKRLVPVQALDFYVPSGNAYLQLKRYREAEAEYDRAIALGSRNLYVYYNRAICRWQRGDSTGAAQDLNEARRLSAAQGAGGTSSPSPHAPGGSAP